MKICKYCSSKVFSKGLCLYHDKVYNPNKYKLKVSKPSATKQKARKATGEKDLFLEIWKERKHICVNCKTYLGEEPLVHYFSHIKGKGAYPELRLDKDNIQLLCRDCHYAFDFQGIDKYKSRAK